MNIKDELNRIKEDAYKAFSERIIKTSYPILGVRAKALRDMAKQIAKTEGLAAVGNIDDSSYEELMLQGLVIGYSKEKIEVKEEYLTQFLQKCDCWSLVDSTSATFKLKKDDLSALWQVMNKWRQDSQLCLNYPYLERFILVMEIDQYLDDQHIDEIIDYSRDLKERDYTIKMANAWLLATAFVNYPDKVYGVIDDLDMETTKYFKQKVRDSLRISAEDKKKVTEYGC